MRYKNSVCYWLNQVFIKGDKRFLIVILFKKIEFRKNPIHPFEDETPLEKFCNKFDSSLFLFGAHSKKHPNGLVFGRMHDENLLDMVHLRMETFIPAAAFEVRVLKFSDCLF